MDRELFKERKDDVVARHGEWTSHNIRLEDDLYTMAPRVVGNEIRIKRVLRILADLSPRPLSELRILDLGSLEGGFAIELARHGAQAVAVEGREDNVAKIQVVKDALGLDTLEVIQGDVRDLRLERHGQFDVILNLGLLYHLDVPDVFHLMENLTQMCRYFTVINTHVSLERIKSVNYQGETYWGRSYREHSEGSSREERLSNLWASLDNPSSFWPTRASLYNLLINLGYTSVYECHTPPTYEVVDRVTLVAIKGRQVQMLSCPPDFSQSVEKCPEDLPVVSQEPCTAQSCILRSFVKKIFGKK